MGYQSLLWLEVYALESIVSWLVVHIHIVMYRPPMLSAHIHISTQLTFKKSMWCAISNWLDIPLIIFWINNVSIICHHQVFKSMWFCLDAPLLYFGPILVILWGGGGIIFLQVPCRSDFSIFLCLVYDIADFLILLYIKTSSFSFICCSNFCLNGF